MKLFPDDDRQGRILCHALTSDFLFYSTDVSRTSSPQSVYYYYYYYYIIRMFLSHICYVQSYSIEVFAFMTDMIKDMHVQLGQSL